MLLYSNGDGCSAGAEIVGNYCFAEEDEKHHALGKRAHPGAVPLTFSYKLAKTLNYGYMNDAESFSSNERILRTTKEFLDQSNQEVFLLIGWSRWDREEPHENNTYTDDLTSLRQKAKKWHQLIYEFHLELQQQNIKHLFFNSYNHFDDEQVPVAERKDWGDSYIDPYDINKTYYWYLKSNFNTVNPNSYHFDEHGHTAWFKYLLPWLTKVQDPATIKQVKVKHNIQSPKAKLNNGKTS
ncbi:MAG: hypothetical protein H8D23_39090 [Candidatus Brocadiales bacterium]|nr:hypothetical protein [Candidatus Brocadiales bacterium]